MGKKLSLNLKVNDSMILSIKYFYPLKDLIVENLTKDITTVILSQNIPDIHELG